MIVDAEEGVKEKIESLITSLSMCYKYENCFLCPICAAECRKQNRYAIILVLKFCSASLYKEPIIKEEDEHEIEDEYYLLPMDNKIKLEITDQKIKDIYS